MPKDAGTTSFYAKEAERYAALTPGVNSRRYRDRFLASLAPGSHIIDLGCGGGRDSRAFLDAGNSVTAMDGSAELAEIAAQRLGQAVEVTAFQDMVFAPTFDGAWAAASLLHVPNDELDMVFASIAKALKPQGVFFAGFKQADSAWRDKMGRYFCAMTETMLRTYLARAGFGVDFVESYVGLGSDGQVTTWIWSAARKA